MTQSSSGAVRIPFTGDGANKTFGYGVRIASADDLQVYVDGVLQPGSAYTVTGIFANGGGSVVFTVAPALDAAGLILVRPATSQLIDFQKGVLDAESVERAVDRLTLGWKHLLDHVGRSLRLSDTDSAAAMAALPPLETLKGALLGFDATTGAPVAASAGLATAIVSSFVQMLLTASDEASFRTGIGITFGAALGNVLQVVDVGGNPGLPILDGSNLTNVGSSLPIGLPLPWLLATPPAGYLPLNGETFGSGDATADYTDDAYETLFTGLWDSMADTEAPVAGGRGASAAADWGANKAMTLPDFRGRSPIGAGAGGSLTERVLGTKGGTETHQLTAAQSGLPAHPHTTTFGGASATATNDSGIAFARAGVQASTSSVTAQDAAEAHPIMPPWIAVNWIVRAA